MEHRRFDGLAALVTGAGNGLGRAHAIELARRGAKVMVNDVARDADGVFAAERVVQALRREGLTAESDTGSVGVEADAIAAVARTVEAFGTIDILVNNAGAGVNQTVQETRTDDFSFLLTVHLYGTLWTMRAALESMRARNYGRIVNTASALGAFGAPASCAYVTAKAGIIGLSKAAALDNEDRDIRINALLPVAYTQMSKTYFEERPALNVNLEPERVSPAVLLMAHRDCPLNGQVLSAAAGRVALTFTAAVPGYFNPDMTCEDLFENMDTVLDTTGFRILKSSVQQYEMTPSST